MVDLVLEKVKYIPGVPLDLTQHALKQCLFDGNKVFGLVVFLPHEPEKKFYVEIMIDSNDQLIFLREKSILPLDQGAVYYRFMPHWSDYVGLRYEQNCQMPRSSP